ncbi:MAG TPA: NPCBM/NEW2 domain-containing protein [Pirellulales bacterium]|nr:NPCBM/NEW2 domain-containing protein [Pirellulales bacterium]
MNLTASLGCWLLLAAAAPEPKFQLRTTAGESFSGALVEFSATQIALETATGRQTAPTESLLALAPETSPAPPDAKPAVWIELVDGSALVAASYNVAAGQASFETLMGGKVTLPTRDIANVRFNSQTPELAAQWAEILGVKHAGDVIVIRKKEALDYQSGVAGDTSDEKVQFTLDGETLSVKRSRVEGLVFFHPAGRELPESVCRVTDASGARFEVQTAQLADGALELTTPAGLKMRIALNDVAAIDGKIQYLSDLTPESVDWRPFFGEASASASLKEFHRPRFNCYLDGGPLRLGRQEYAKGVALYSGSELAYRLPPGRFRRLKAMAGIDDRSRPEGAVRLTILGDDKPLYEGDLTGRDEPLPLDLDVTGVSRLKLVVDFGEGQEVQDHFDLCDARILK